MVCIYKIHTYKNYTLITNHFLLFFVSVVVVVVVVIFVLLEGCWFRFLLFRYSFSFVD